jgi:hypothetical protein
MKLLSTYETRDRIKADLQRRLAVSEIPSITSAGIYALYTVTLYFFAGIEADPTRPLYLGMTEDSLEVRNHFGHKSSSFSSPRRSLGAALKKDLELSAIPRGSGRSVKDITNYHFGNGGEENLSTWMAHNLRYSFSVVEEGIRQFERELIEEFQPPLNLTGWKNPQKPLLMKLRKVCRDEARTIAKLKSQV